jgi:hypothetical protein
MREARGARPKPVSRGEQRLPVPAEQLPSTPHLPFLAMCILSCTVTIRTTNGSLYEGLFHTYQAIGKEVNVVLRHVKTLQKEGKPVEERARKPLLLIRHNHLAELKAKEVHLTGQDISAVALREASQFEDSSVAGKDAQHRELQAFVFDKNAADGLDEWDAEATGWAGDDMFKQNADKFGVETTFDMDQYTVALQNDGKGVSATEAARIEREILASHCDDAHTREERGLLDDSGMSEEDRYGAVLRAPPAGAQPQIRTRPQAQQPRGENADSASGGAAAGAPAQGTFSGRGRGWGREPGRMGQGAGGTRGATEERQVINKMRQSLTEGKSLKTAVDREMQQQYTNDVAAVDALNLNPGLGSMNFRPEAKPEVAHKLLHFKVKRESSGTPSALAAAAAEAHSASAAAPQRITAPASGSATGQLTQLGTSAATATDSAAPAVDAAAGSTSTAAAAAAPKAPKAGAQDNTGAVTPRSTLKASADSAKAFKFTLASTTKEFKAKDFVPKSATATPRSTGTPFSAASSKGPRNERGGGSAHWHAGNRGERGRGSHRNREDQASLGLTDQAWHYGQRGSHHHRSGPNKDAQPPMVNFGTPVHPMPPMLSPSQVNMSAQHGFLPHGGGFSQAALPGQAAMMPGMPQSYQMARMIMPGSYIQGQYAPNFHGQGLVTNFVMPAGPIRPALHGPDAPGGLPGQHHAPNI